MRSILIFIFSGACMRTVSRMNTCACARDCAHNGHPMRWQVNQECARGIAYRWHMCAHKLQLEDAIDIDTGDTTRHVHIVAVHDSDTHRRRQSNSATISVTAAVSASLVFDAGLVLCLVCEQRSHSLRFSASAPRGPSAADVHALLSPYSPSLPRQ